MEKIVFLPVYVYASKMYILLLGLHQKDAPDETNGSY